MSDSAMVKNPRRAAANAELNSGRDVETATSTKPMKLEPMPV
jgi:hypothetical protein